jgi:hypothetical protein
VNKNEPVCGVGLRTRSPKWDWHLAAAQGLNSSLLPCLLQVGHLPGPYSPKDSPGGLQCKSRGWYSLSARPSPVTVSPQCRLIPHMLRRGTGKERPSDLQVSWLSQAESQEKATQCSSGWI